MFQIPYTSQLYAEDAQYVAVCPELNVSSFGDTPAEALASLKEAVALFSEFLNALRLLKDDQWETYDPVQGVRMVREHVLGINAARIGSLWKELGDTEKAGAFFREAREHYAAAMAQFPSDSPEHRAIESDLNGLGK